MANVTFSVPDPLVPRLSAAMRDTFPQYAALTDGQAFKACTADYWKKILIDYESRQAILTSQASVAAIRDQAIASAIADSSTIG